MKRLLSLVLGAALLAACAAPFAAAEEPAADARLAQVTQAVKEILDLDTNAYGTFKGAYSENLVPVWDLNWESDQRYLSIQALEDGTILQFYRWENSVQPADYRYAFPTFPESGTGGRAAAEEFLSRVLRPGETAEFSEPDGGRSPLGAPDSSWSGPILLNGLPSPFSWSISVEDGQVSRFSRDLPETTVASGVPSSDAPAERDKASVNLKNTLELRPEYVLESSGASRAVLRYMPENTHEFLVDAKTGEFLDVTELREKLSSGGVNGLGYARDAAAPTAAMEAAGGEKGLTGAERDGIQELEGALSKEELDKALRAEEAYGLRGYALSSVGFERTDQGPRCTLRYGRISGEDRLYRTFYVNARTGEVLSIYSSAPQDRKAVLTQDEARERAEAYLKKLWPDRTLEAYSAPDYGVLPLRSLNKPCHEFRFARMENGYPFPANSYNISIDSSDGSIYDLSFDWDESVTFDSPSGLVSADTANAAWAGTYETALAYRLVPQKLTAADPIQARLIEQGMEYYNGLRLTYGLEREGNYSGVDGKTGKPVQNDRENSREPLGYGDIAGNAAKADIEKLAQYGVGYAAENFRPGKTLTQWELAALVYSLQGAPLDPGDAGEDARNSAYFYAYRSGLLRQTERDDNAVLSRSQLVKMLLDAAGYGPAARLGGQIFSCDYADKAAIPEEGLGYAAMAQALGMASETYAGSRSATRGEAASMLCRILERAG